MTRLRCLPSRLTAAPARLATISTGADTGFVRTDGRTAAARGYDASWRRVRLAHLDAHPLCASCERQGRVTAATQVHHIQRFLGIEDPLRLDPRNLESICRPCHAQESARQANGKG